MATRESLQGLYLNDLIGLKAVGDKIMVNPLDVLFPAVLNPRVMVLTIQLSAIPNVSRLYKFIQEEAPLGCLMLVLIYGPNLTDEFTLPPTESITFGSYALGSAVEQVGINQLGVDFVRLKRETAIQ